jgi:hypothetical protein
VLCAVQNGTEWRVCCVLCRMGLSGVCVLCAVQNETKLGGVVVIVEVQNIL